MARNQREPQEEFAGNEELKEAQSLLLDQLKEEFNRFCVIYFESEDADLQFRSCLFNIFESGVTNTTSHEEFLNQKDIILKKIFNSLMKKIKKLEKKNPLLSNWTAGINSLSYNKILKWSSCIFLNFALYHIAHSDNGMINLLEFSYNRKIKNVKEKNFNNWKENN